MRKLFLAVMALLIASCNTNEDKSHAIADSGGNGTVIGSGTLKKDFSDVDSVQVIYGRNGEPITITQPKKKDYAALGDSGGRTIAGGTLIGGKKQDLMFTALLIPDSGHTGIFVPVKKKDHSELVVDSLSFNVLNYGNHG